jgi:hypothetical protein
VLHVLGVTKSSEKASYTFQNEAGAERTLELTAQSNDQYDAIDWHSAFQPLPTFMQAQEEAIRFEPLADGKTLYISFRSYPGRREMNEVAKQVRKHLEQNSVNKLVIDLRGNGGGDFKKGLHLIEEIGKTGVHEAGRVYALTDRWTFSAAMSNAAHCREQLSAVLVGEPASERPNGYAENHSFTLPNSGIPASCSSRYYEFQKQDTPTLEPDQHIEPDFLAWSTGRDPVLEWVLDQ